MTPRDRAIAALPAIGLDALTADADLLTRVDRKYVVPMDATASLLHTLTHAALGSSGMAESPDESSAQGWLAATASGSAGSTVRITDATGAVIAGYTAEKTFATVVFSSSAITDEQSYTVTVDGTATSVTAGLAVACGMGMGGGGMGGGRS